MIARSTAGPSLFAVLTTAPGVKVTALDVVDPTRPLSQIDLADSPAVLLGTEGPFGNVLKIRPPMPFTHADGERLCRALDRVLGELA